MSLKMKSCKKSIFLADIKRFWVFSLLYGGVIFFSTFFDFYLNKEPYGNSIPYSFVGSRFFAYSCLSNFFGLVAGAIIALMLFSFLYNVSSISFYHGLPFTRKSIFLSKLLSAAVLLTVPVLVNFAIVGITKLCGSDIQIRWLSLIYWLGNQLIYSFLAFVCVVFAVMISGNILSLLATCFLLGIAPIAIIGFIHTACQNYLFGYAYDPTTYFNLFYITPDRLLFEAYGLIYVIAIPLLLVISYFMYKKRALERCGEAVVFPKLKTFFIYFAGLLGGIFGYFYFSIWAFKSIIFMLPFGIAAVIIANMINKRGITLKGALPHTLIFTACVLILLGAFHYDIAGFENRIPQNIESVTVIPDRYSRYMEDATLQKYAITDQDDINKVIAYHQSKIEGDRSEKGYAPSNVDILYKLENGRTMKRSYNVNFAEEKEYFDSVAAIDKVKNILYPIYDMPSDVKIVNIYLHNFLSSVYFYPDSEISDELMTAMQEDIKNLSYEENAALLWNSMYCDTPLYVDIEYKSPENDKPYNLSYYFPISFGFTNTMEVLKKYDYYDRFMTVNYIDMVGIDRDSDAKGEFTISDWRVDEIITDKNEMAEILEMLQTSYRRPYESENDTDFDEYIFLDQHGNSHTFSIRISAAKKAS